MQGSRRRRRARSSLHCDNVAVVTGDLAQGYPKEGPYDAIIVEGAVASVPSALLHQLKDGGRLVAVIVDGGEPGGAVAPHRQAFDHVTAFDARAAPRLRARRRLRPLEAVRRWAMR